VFRWTDNRARARNLARIATEQNRESLVIRYAAKMHAWPLTVGDRVTVTDTEYGWDAKVFRVTDWQWDLHSAVLLTLQEDGESLYDEADAASADSLPNTGLPDPFAAPDAISGLACESGSNHVLLEGDGSRALRVLVSWDAITNAYVTQGGSVRLRWRRLGGDAENTWHEISSLGDATSEYLIGAGAGELLIVGASAVNAFGKASEEVFINHLATYGGAQVGGATFVIAFEDATGVTYTSGI
jgi:hypothetical protein